MHMPQLEELNLADNHLNHFHDRLFDAISRMRRLRILILSGNRVPVEWIKELSHIDVVVF